MFLVGKGEFVGNIANHQEVNQQVIVDQPVVNNTEFIDQFNKIEKELNDYIVKTNAILTAVVEDLENLKSDDVTNETINSFILNFTAKLLTINPDTNRSILAASRLKNTNKLFTPFFLILFISKTTLHPPRPLLRNQHREPSRTRRVLRDSRRSTASS